MRETKCRLTSFCFAITFFLSATAQNLTPEELSQIHHTSDFRVITNSLANKGFKLQSNQQDERTNETVARWYFPSSPYGGEEVISYLIKSVDSIKGSKTTFLLYHPSHYKELIDKLLKSKFEFKGIQILGNNSYSVFKNKKLVILSRERWEAENRKYFEMIIQKE